MSAEHSTHLALSKHLLADLNGYPGALFVLQQGLEGLFKGSDHKYFMQNQGDYISTYITT
jgi:hypothetical protein